MSKLTVVVGGQLGSEGKGAITGWLSRPENNPDTRVVGVRVGGPNAGHTVYGRCPGDAAGIVPCNQCDGFGHPWRLRTVPVAAVCNPEAKLIIAAGSEVDFDVLESELGALDQAGYQASHRLTVDRFATVLEPEHRYAEETADMNRRLGSTAKGIGAARSDRIWRRARLIRDLESESMPCDVGDTTEWLNSVAWSERTHILIEGTQGYGLGLHTEDYPCVTSGDCRAIDFLAQAGISPWCLGITSFRVFVVVRPNPIRVAGNSGPLLDETSWEELGLQPELTTVTKKVRRVGAWDAVMVEQAVRANGGGPSANGQVTLALTMADHRFPFLEGRTDLEGLADDQIRQVRDWVNGAGAQVMAYPTLLGTGPDSVIDLSCDKSWIENNG